MKISIPGFFSIGSDKEEDKKVVPTANVTSSNTIPSTQQWNVSGNQTAPNNFVNTSNEDSIKFKEHFIKLFNESNLPGPDYYEFSQAIHNSNNQMPEQMAYPTIFSTLKTMGLNKTNLVTSVDEYLKILEKDQISFNGQIQQKRVELIEKKSKEIESLNLEITSTNQQISALQDKIRELQGKIVTLGNEKVINEQKINTSESNYLFALQTMQTQLRNDLEKINQYIIEQ